MNDVLQFRNGRGLLYLDNVSIHSNVVTAPLTNKKIERGIVPQMKAQEIVETPTAAHTALAMEESSSSAAYAEKMP
jgi:hypothetical protein